MATIEPLTEQEQQALDQMRRAQEQRTTLKQDRDWCQTGWYCPEPHCDLSASWYRRLQVVLVRTECSWHSPTAILSVYMPPPVEKMHVQAMQTLWLARWAVGLSSGEQLSGVP
jgi:hypothetical protein